jgi:uncharacterized membrane protein (DUF485 family)
MAEPLVPKDEAQAARTHDAPHQHIDWEAIEASPEFQELVPTRRSFVVPGTIFFLSWYMGFIVLAAYAEDFMSERVMPRDTTASTDAVGDSMIESSTSMASSGGGRG